MQKPQTHAYDVMRGLDDGPAGNAQVLRVNVEDDHGSQRQGRGGLNVTAGEADVAQVPPRRRPTFLLAKFDSAGAQISWMFPFGGLHISPGRRRASQSVKSRLRVQSSKRKHP